MAIIHERILKGVRSTTMKLLDLIPDTYPSNARSDMGVFKRAMERLLLALCVSISTWRSFNCFMVSRLASATLVTDSSLWSKMANYMFIMFVFVERVVV